MRLRKVGDGGLTNLTPPLSKLKSFKNYKLVDLKRGDGGARCFQSSPDDSMTKTYKAVQEKKRSMSPDTVLHRSALYSPGYT